MSLSISDTLYHADGTPVVGYTVTATPAVQPYVQGGSVIITPWPNAASNGSGVVSFSLPWPSEAQAGTWTINLPGGAITGTVPEGVAGPVRFDDLMNATYGWGPV